MDGAELGAEGAPDVMPPLPSGWLTAVRVENCASGASWRWAGNASDALFDHLPRALERAAAEGAGLLILDSPSRDVASTVAPVIPASEVSSDEPIHAAWLPQGVQGSLIARCLAVPVWLAQRTLLRTGLTSLARGAVMVPPGKCRQLVAAGFQPQTAGQLLAAARTLGIAVVEARHDVGERTPTTKGVRGLFGDFAETLRFWWSGIAFPAVAEEAREPEGLANGAGWLGPVLLLAAAIAMMFVNLGYPLFEPDETRNAELAMHILQTGEWLALQLDGGPYWDKPPLLAWMTAASYRTFGMSEWATRLPGALCGLLTICIVFWIGGRMLGRRAALLGSVVLLVSTGFPLMSRFVTMDAPLALFTTTMFLAALRGTRNGQYQHGWMILAGVACGLGLLVKGPVTLVIVLPPLLLSGWLSGETWFRRREFWLWSGVPALLISGPWYLATAIVHPEFVNHFFLKHNLQRFSEAFNHRQPVWFYFPVLFLAMYPASLLLIPLVRMLAAGRESRSLLGRPEAALILAAGWTVGFFSLSESKLPTYILPAVPALALLLGRLIDLSLTPSRASIGQSWMGLMPWHMAVSVAVMTGLAALLLLADAIREREPLQGSILMALVATALAATALLVVQKVKSPRIAWTASLGSAFVFALVVLSLVVPELSRDRSMHAAVAHKITEPGCETWPVLYFGERSYATKLPMPHERIVWLPLDAVEETCWFLQEHPHVILVTHPFNVTTLRRHLGPAVQIEAEPEQRKLFVTSSGESTRLAREPAATGPVY